MAKRDRPDGSEPFDVTLPEGFELGEHESALEAAAKQAGWTIERRGASIAVRDVWTDNEDHAAWLVATRWACRSSASPSGLVVGSSPTRARRARQPSGDRVP